MQILNKWWLWIIVALGTGLMLLLYYLPGFARNALQTWLTDQGISEVTYSRVELGFLDREIRIAGLHLRTPRSRDVYLKEASLKLSVIPLWSNTLHINRIGISDSEINATLREDGSWDIAGLKLPLDSGTGKQSAQPGWNIHLDNITIDNTRVSVVTPDLSGTIKINRASMVNRPDINMESNINGKFPAWHYDLDGQLQVRWNRPNLEVTTHINSSGTLPQSSQMGDSLNLLARTTLTRLQIVDITRNLEVLRVDSANSRDIVIKNNVVSVSRITFENAGIGNPSSEKESLTPFARLQTVTLDRLQWIPDRQLDIDKISLSSPNINAKRLKSGKWQTLSRLEQLAATGEPAKPRTGQMESGKPLQLVIKSIKLESPATIVVDDHTVSPPVLTRLVLKKGSLLSVDNRQQENKSPFSLSGTIGGYGRFDVEGEWRPFARAATYSIKSTINDLDLPLFSPYMVSESGYSVLHGHLDMNARLQTTKGKVEGNSELTFKKLKINPVDQAAIDKLSKRLTMPLETILLMLEDKERIRLKVPISGSAADPDFSFSDALDKALLSALRTASLGYVKYYFQPYGTVITVIQLGDKVFRMRLNPVVFAAGGSTLDETAQDYLKRVARLMKEKKRLDLSICGRSVPADETTNKEEANALARRRSENVRNYLAEDQKVASKRLYMCQPEPDTRGDALPRVDLEF